MKNINHFRLKILLLFKNGGGGFMKHKFVILILERLDKTIVVALIFYGNKLHVLLTCIKYSIVYSRYITIRGGLREGAFPLENWGGHPTPLENLRRNRGSLLLFLKTIFFNS